MSRRICDTSRSMFTVHTGDLATWSSSVGMRNICMYIRITPTQPKAPRPEPLHNLRPLTGPFPRNHACLHTPTPTTRATCKDVSASGTRRPLGAGAFHQFKSTAPHSIFPAIFLGGARPAFQLAFNASGEWCAPMSPRRNHQGRR